MKKIKFLTAMFTSLISAGLMASTPIALVNADFELPGTVKIRGWDGTGAAGSATQDIPGWSSSPAASDSGVETNGGATSGSWIAFVMTGDPSLWQTTGHTIAAGQSFTLSADLWDTAYNGDTKLAIYYLDGTNRVELASRTVTLNSTVTRYSVDAFIAAGSPAIGKKVGVEIDNVAAHGNSNSWAGVDTVTLDMGYVAPVSPTIGETFVDINGSLQWAVANGWSVDLYLATDEPNLAIVPANKKLTQQSATTYSFNNLNYYQDYFWRVDAYEPNGTDYIIHEGPVWTFTTVAQKPLIVNDIDDQTVAYGVPAVFTVTASSTEHATWYKLGQADSLEAGAKYSMSVVPNGDKFDAQLTIADMTIADEGIYYAILGNTATTETTRTRDAELLAGRLMGWWEFNGGIADSVTTVEPEATAHEGAMITTGTTDPYTSPLNYSAGIIDQALVFAPPAAGGDQNNSAAYFAAVGSDTDMNFTPRGFSVAVWFKTSHAGWGAIVGKGRRNTNGWIMEHNGNTISLVFRGGGTATLNSAEIADGQWHLLVGSYNPAKGKVEMYASSIDDAGQYRLKYASADSSAPGIVTDQPMTIGIELDPTFSNVYTMVYGEVDDVKMYSYALSDMEIAELLFYPVVNMPVCVESQIGEKGKYDFNNDCQVDILDFASFAQFWMESSIYTTVQ